MTSDMPTYLPAPPQDPNAADQCRLWIGNLDPRVTEFALLKILQKFGNLLKFDLMYHKSGPDQGKHRGYCFATYENKEEASYACQCLDGKLLLSKNLSVKLAHSDKDQNIGLPLTVKVLKEDAKLSNIDSNSGLSRESKIRAIEAKLRAMEESQKDFTYSLAPAAAPGTSKWCSSQMASTRKPQNNKPYRRTFSKR
ncbi:probable RNA-binding protein 18 [Octopus bimaculoides]|uniref:Probable RNA-binding protein 18 n=1 Tax=Octopus bimaculoides TaxID=37653 RepID=A0A0L8FNC8_OCTBM|nr:probable RNA-binding protein 18 [Octopus bimaculoides]|eukprot:XP_014788321.1 PREDICTED: probable RNA-binding protein 18 [Octopus bimaculoides]